MVIKAQVQIGGRGKAGGIKLANDRAEAEANAKAILGMDIRGFTVHELYVEQASEIDEEYYAAIVFDRSAKKPMAMLSRWAAWTWRRWPRPTPRPCACCTWTR